MNILFLSLHYFIKKIMFRISSGLPLYRQTLKNLEFEIFLTLKILEFWTKNPEFLTILICSVVKFRLDTKSLSFKQNFFVIIIIFFFHKKHIKLNFKLKIDPEICNFKNLEEILKTWKKLGKNEWQPCVMYSCINIFMLYFNPNR